jgi:hypothetical protein
MRREYTKTLYKKREKNTLDQNFFLSFFPFGSFKPTNKKEENTMTTMKIYLARSYIARDREKGRKILRQKTYETMNSCQFQD